MSCWNFLYYNRGPTHIPHNAMSMITHIFFGFMSYAAYPSWTTEKNINMMFSMMQFISDMIIVDLFKMGVCTNAFGLPNILLYHFHICFIHSCDKYSIIGNCKDCCFTLTQSICYVLIFVQFWFYVIVIIFCKWINIFIVCLYNVVFKSLRFDKCMCFLISHTIYHWKTLYHYHIYIFYCCDCVLCSVIPWKES